MPKTPNGIPYPGNPTTEPPNGPAQIGAVAEAVDSKLVGRFVSQAALDVAFPNPIRGMVATIGNQLWLRTSTEWVLPGASARASRSSADGFNPTLANSGGPNDDGWIPFDSDSRWVEEDPWNLRTSGGTIVARWNGRYKLSAGGNFAPNASGVRGLRFNPVSADFGRGAGFPMYVDVRDATSGGSPTIISGTVPVVTLQAGEVVKLEGRQSSASGLVVDNVWIDAVYLGPN